MGFANAVKGYLSIQGLMTGISITLCLFAFGVMMITFGSLNVNNKKDPNYKKFFAPKKETTKTCGYYRTDGSCKRFNYSTTYDTTKCSNMSAVTKIRGKQNNMVYEQHIETGDCRKPKMTKKGSVVLLVVGCLLVLSAMLTAYITSDEEARMIFAFSDPSLGPGSMGTGSSGTGFKNIVNGFKNILNAVSG
jgi:hypothetical protein